MLTMMMRVITIPEFAMDDVEYVRRCRWKCCLYKYLEL